MGDRRYVRFLDRIAKATDRAKAIQSLTEEEVVQALAAASRAGPEADYLANVLATEAMNRMRRARAAEAALRVSEAKYRLFFHSAEDPTVVADTKRRIVECNPAFENALGYTADEIRGKTTRIFYESEDEYRAMGEALRAWVPDSRPFRRLCRFRKKSGEVFLAQVSVLDVRDSDGALVGYMGFVRDVTERERFTGEAHERVEHAAGKVHEMQRLGE